MKWTADNASDLSKAGREMVARSPRHGEDLAVSTVLEFGTNRASPLTAQKLSRFCKKLKSSMLIWCRLSSDSSGGKQTKERISTLSRQRRLEEDVYGLILFLVLSLVAWRMIVNLMMFDE